MSDSEITISQQTVADLLHERVRVREDINHLSEKLGEIDRQVDALKVLAPQFFDAKKHTRQLALDGVASEKSESLIDAIEKAVLNGGYAMSPKEIRAAVKTQGDGDLITNDNYIYTAIKRLADAQRIEKLGDGYVAPQ